MGSKGDSDFPVAAFEVTVGGQKLSPEAVERVSEITVDLSLDKAGMFTMQAGGSGEEDDEEDNWIDDELFAIGKAVEVKMGHGAELGFLFGGEITGLDPSFSFERPPTMTVRCYDRSYCMQRGIENRTFTKVKYSDIASRIATEAKLTPQVEDSLVVHDFVYQANQSNLKFLRALAKEINYELMVEDKTLIFRRAGVSGRAAITLTMEKDLAEFSARLSAARQVTEVVVRGWSPAQKKEIKGRAVEGDAPRMGDGKSAAALGKEACGEAVEIVSWHPVMSQAEADQMAAARFGAASLSLLEGNGSTNGRADLRPGRVINITGVGRRFSGPYYVTETTHRFDQENGYRTNFSVRRNAL